jgi:hypothetical protein
VHREFRDALENYLIIDVEINKTRYGIGAIYGPNSTSREFFHGLGSCLRSLKATGSSQFILGGDWNTTIDRNPVTSNIDTFFMSGLPNPVNSELLNRLCSEFEMLDPFRALYPTKRDYTYLPFGTVRLNRSRIDFFVISASILNSVSDCSINDAVSCKLFDHKQVNLLLNSSKTAHPAKTRLSNSYLTDECLRFSVDIAARRTHLYSLDCVMLNGINTGFRDRELTRVSEALNQYQGLLKIMEAKAKQGIDIELDEEVKVYKQRLRMLFEEMAPLADIERIAKSCVHSAFFTALIDEVRNAGSKTQKYLSRLNKCYEQALSKNLLLLKDDYVVNRDAIADIENILKIRADNSLRDKIKDIKIFECLNAEKATPLLLDLAKKSGGGESLDNIRDDNGEVFSSEVERKSFILNYYTDLYKADANVEGSIEDFLGPTICAKTTVLESKLTNYERSELDKQLDITELDAALKHANMRSAPGIDGYSYRFINHFWNIFRYPLFKCAEEGLEDNTLPEFFKTAVIKLIPKKGDTSRIKNWRPISLLSNFYKIISRLINTRLQAVCDRLLSRAQKGFTKSRQIQEVIINCMETMDFCRKQNIKGVIASIDQTKAFDSVSHTYMEKVYDFFNFGPRIKVWLRSIGTQRTACVALNNGVLSATFPLGKGHAQGDSPSPLLYNLAAQIQIFRLEFNEDIERIGVRLPAVRAEVIPPVMQRRRDSDRLTLMSHLLMTALTSFFSH